ncbi:hypothetical protein MRX96_008895 [Rhipicephalus microplus]
MRDTIGECSCWKSWRLGLNRLNDPRSRPTYETIYAASWTDVTLATPSVLMAGYRWEVREDVIYFEHININVCTWTRRL